MCIIAIKPKTVGLWDYATVRRMFESNPDGAGYCYPYEGKVAIKKGFATPDSLYSSLKSVAPDLPIILHCRIGTHGSKTRPENTHPFPITDKSKYLESRRIKCPVAVVHNGIISGMGTREQLSDTQIFIADVLHPFFEHYPAFYTDAKYVDIIKKLIGTSKLAFLDSDGGIYTIGNFITTKEGYMYSNASYEERKCVIVQKKNSGTVTVWNSHEYARYVYPVPKTTYYMLDTNTKVFLSDNVWVDANGRLFQQIKGQYVLVPYYVNVFNYPLQVGDRSFDEWLDEVIENRQGEVKLIQGSYNHD